MMNIYLPVNALVTSSCAIACFVMLVILIRETKLRKLNVADAESLQFFIQFVLWSGLGVSATVYAIYYLLLQFEFLTVADHPAWLRPVNLILFPLMFYVVLLTVRNLHWKKEHDRLARDLEWWKVQFDDMQREMLEAERRQRKGNDLD